MQLDSTCDLLEVLIHVKQSCWHQHILTINHCWVYQIPLVSCSNPSDLQAHTAVQTLSNLKCYPSHLRQNPTAWLEAFPIGHPTRIHGLLCRKYQLPFLCLHVLQRVTAPQSHGRSPHDTISDLDPPEPKGAARFSLRTIQHVLELFLDHQQSCWRKRGVVLYYKASPHSSCYWLLDIIMASCNDSSINQQEKAE